VTIPEQFTYAPDPGGWPPPGEWQQHHRPRRPRRRTGRLVAAIGAGLALLVLTGAGGFAAGWSAHPDTAARQSTTAPYLPFAPGTGEGSQPGTGPDGSGSGSAGGDGYAIPIGTARTIADQIRAGRSSGTVHIGATAYLGIETTGERGYQSVPGPTVLGVVAGSPADSAGLTRGDVIRSVAGATVGSATALTNRLDRYHPGDRVKLAWTDLSGQSHTGSVELATGPVG
jgi:hypothetical protein